MLLQFFLIGFPVLCLRSFWNFDPCGALLADSWRCLSAHPPTLSSCKTGQMMMMCGGWLYLSTVGVGICRDSKSVFVVAVTVVG